MNRHTTVLALLLPILAVGDLMADDVYSKQASWPLTMVATRDNVIRHGDSAETTQGKFWNALLRRLWDDWPQMDWFLQDGPERVHDNNVDTQRAIAWYFVAHRNTDVERDLIQRVLSELGAAGDEFRGRLQTLTEQDVPASSAAWLELYVDACQARRCRRLQPLLAKTPRFVFTKHYTLGGSHYAYTEGQSDAQAERHFVPNSALCLASWDGNRVQVETLLEDPAGVIRDPDVSYDGRRVLFSWKKSDRDDDYHLYEMTLANRSIRQITDGLGMADYEGVYLPNDDIIFNSTRCVQTVDCWWTEVSNLYRCDQDGRFMRRLAFDQVHDNFPTVTDDGRVLYTRWEYNDRGQIYPQPLLQMNPDGTTQTEFYGANSWFPTTILHARGIPGSQKVVAIATGHHSRQTGQLILIDPSAGRQENEGVRLIAPVRETPAVKVDAFGQQGELFQYPYPLSETEFLVTYHPIGWAWRDGDMGPRFGIYFMTIDGRRERLVSDARLPCNQPIPLRSRPTARVRPDAVDYGQTTGTCYVQDVYAGQGLAGVARGTVKTLRVVSIAYRAAGIGSNGNRGPGGGALISTPIAIGNGAWDPKTIIGDATVYADGSAFFRLPARTPVYFQLLDEKHRLVQTMRSWTTIQPNENASCVGCHEHKNNTPVAAQPLTEAVAAGVETLKPFHGSTRGFSFSTEIQPILDRHCAGCHAGNPDVPYDLTARRIEDRRAKRWWNQAYLTLTHSRPDDVDHNSGWRGNADHAMVNWVSSQSEPTLQPPYAAGSNQSRLIRILDDGHYDVALSTEELDRLAAWIDLGVPFCGDYVESNAWNEAEKEKYRHFTRKRERLQAEDQAAVRDFHTSLDADSK